jgi:hypothetical protein
MREINVSKRNELAAAAKKRAGEKGISLGQALSEIGRENPSLVEASRLEVTGVKTRIETVGPCSHQVVDVAEQLAVMAHERAAQKNISYRAALSEIGKETPGLVHLAREQVVGGNI